MTGSTGDDGGDSDSGDMLNCMESRVILKTRLNVMATTGFSTVVDDVVSGILVADRFSNCKSAIINDGQKH